MMARGDKDPSDYMINIILAPVSLFFVIRSSLILKGKAKHADNFWVWLKKIGTIFLYGFCALFMIGLFVHALSIGEYGIMLFALTFFLMFGFSGYFCIKRHTSKEKASATNMDDRKSAIHQQREHAESKAIGYKAEYLDDITFIEDIKYTSFGSWKQYDILLAARNYGWDMMKDWADYMAQADLMGISQVISGALSHGGTDCTKSYLENGAKCIQTPELNMEAGMLSIAGISGVLHAPVKIIWYNQTRALRLFTTIDDEVLVSCYVETMARRTFGTDSALKLGQPILKEQPGGKDPVSFIDGQIHINSIAFLAWKKANTATPQYEKCGIISLNEKEPTICLFEDSIKTRQYRLQTEGDEDFTGKYFHISVRLGFQGTPAIPVAQIDGFISDTDEAQNMTASNIGYRMEGHFLACGEAAGVIRYEMNRGRDLPAKGLKYPGYTTPSNIRLVGICPSCGKSFCFHGYAFYMAQSDVAYSDDGLDCCEIIPYNIDKENWIYEADGKVFRYYNSFNCPHCGVPYIDYKQYPEDKVFGVSGCVHLGRKVYRAE